MFLFVSGQGEHLDAKVRVLLVGHTSESVVKGNERGDDTEDTSSTSATDLRGKVTDTQHEECQGQKEE